MQNSIKKLELNLVFKPEIYPQTLPKLFDNNEIHSVPHNYTNTYIVL